MKNDQTITCETCPLGKPESCIQDLGESCGWQWWPRKDNSWETCHFNFMLGKEYDPYLRLRNQNNESKRIKEAT